MTEEVKREQLMVVRFVSYNSFGKFSLFCLSDLGITPSLGRKVLVRPRQERSLMLTSVKNLCEAFESKCHKGLSLIFITMSNFHFNFIMSPNLTRIERADV